MKNLNIDRLTGEIKDYDNEVYQFVLNRLLKGIKLKLSKELPFSNDTKICKFSEFISNSFLSTHLDLNKLRGRITTPFYYSVFYPNDLIEVSLISKGIFFVKLIQKDPQREYAETYNHIFDKKEFLTSVKKYFVDYVNFLDLKMNKHDAFLLEKNDIIPKDSFQLRPNKTSKGFLHNVDLPSCKQTFNKLYKENDIWPYNFSSVQGYSLFYLPKINLSYDKVIESEKYIEKIVKLNKNFWGSEIINYSKYRRMIDKYGP